MYTLGQAAKATGKAKSTISEAINTGRISGKRQENGSYIIDPAELHRVFPAVSANSQAEPELDDSERSGLSFQNGVLQGELKQLRERLAGIDTMHERERRALSDQVEDLRARLDQSERERREKDQQLTALLSDQSAKPSASVQAVPVNAAAPPSPGGILGLFRRRKAG